MNRLFAAALAACFGGSTFAALATAASAQTYGSTDYVARESWNSVPQNFFGLQWEIDSFNAQNSIMNAGIQAAINMNKARVATLTGQLTPVASYTVSPAVTSQVEAKMLNNLGNPGSNDKQRAIETGEIRAGYAGYVADAKTSGEPVDNFVTACAYYVTTSLEIEHDKALTPEEKRAIRGDCVTVLGARQQGVGLYVTEPSRQFVSQALATAAGIAVRAYEGAPPDRKAEIKSGVEAGFHQFFGSTLGQIPVDHLACVGAKGPADYAQCDRIPNSRFEAIADNTK